MEGRHVVFGCSGPVGVALMERLAAAGTEVLGVCRSGGSEAPEGATIEGGDVADIESSRRFARGGSVIYGCVGLPYTEWTTAWPGIVEGLLTAAESAGARLVFADNLYCYGPQQRPLTEELPLTEYGRKPALRASLWRRMLAAHAAGRAPVVTVRASDFYGPRVLNSALGERVVPKLLAGKAVEILGHPEMPHTFTYVPDFARALETIARAEEDAYGQAWHVPNAPTETQRQVIERLGRLEGVEPRIRALPRSMLTLGSLFVPLLRELRELMYQWEQPFEVDHSKFGSRFWDDATPLDTGLTATLEWYRSR